MIHRRTTRRAAVRTIAIAEAIEGVDRKTAARRGVISEQAPRNAIKRYNAKGDRGPL